MKKLFKKSIACLIAVLMVVSTMPFTAITAQAATAAENTQLIADINGQGFDGFTATATSAADNSYTKDGLTGGDSMTNVLYSFGVGTSSPYTQRTVTSNTINIGVKYRQNIDYNVQYGSAVFLWNGKDTVMEVPISHYYKRSQFTDNQSTGYITLNSDSRNKGFTLKHDWHGGKMSNAGYNTSTDYKVSSTYTVYDNGLYNSECRFATTLVWSLESISGYSTSVDSLTFDWKHFDKNVTDAITLGNGSTSGNGYPTLYAINYQPVKNLLAEIKASTEWTLAQRETYYTVDTLNAYLKAVKALVTLNPNTYFQNLGTTNDLSKPVSDCVNAMTTAISNYNTAKAALAHEHSFTGAYVNNNDGTHKRQCLHFDICGATTESEEHSYSSSVTTQPTCTTAGVTTYTCACGDSYTKDEPAATGEHSYTVLISEKQEANCTTPGKEAVYKCATCDLTTGGEEIPAPGHTWGDWAYNAADNNEIRECSVCHATEPRACTYKVTGTTTATCTVPGSTTYTCDTCNHSYTTYGEVNPDNHVNKTPVTGQPATCTEDGWSDYEVCNDCNKEIGKTVNSATGHSLKKVNEVPSTCTVKGTAAYWTCTKCNKMFSDEQGKNEIPAPIELQLADHSFTTYTQTLAPTCTTVGKEEAVCDNGCGTKDVRDVAIDSDAHNYGAWVDNKDGKTHKRTCSYNSAHTQTEVHNIVNGACTECDYKAFDMVAYNKAVAEYDAIKIGDYTAKYTAESIKAYEAAVEAAKKNSFASQEEVDAAAAAILSAKTKLVYAQPEIKFVEVDANGKETVIKTKNYTYGTPVEFTKDADNIAKWIVKTQNGNVETKVATSQTTYTMIATEPATVYVHLTEEKTEALEYSKVSFISKNGAVSSVQYVAKGTTIETIDVPGVKIPFYKFMNWDKASVTADGSDIEVKAVYEFIGTVDDKCNVHYEGFEGGVKEYTYDSFVYLFGAEGFKLALATDEAGTNIITYLNENAFYAPHTENVYVIKVPELGASIGITGSYMQTSGDTKIAAFNCKFYVPDGCQVVEYGMTATSSKGSMKIKAEKASDRGEYCIKVSAKVVPSITGVAYLTYKDAKQNLHTIYSNEVIQTL